MATIDLKSLVGRLNEPCRRALEAAAGLTLSRTHYNVEIEHWLIEAARSCRRRHRRDPAPLRGRPGPASHRPEPRAGPDEDRQRAGAVLSPDIVELAKQAWLLASLEQGASRIRSGHLLWALLADETLARRAREASGQLLQIPADLLKRDFAAITADSAEAAEAPAAAIGRRAGCRRWRRRRRRAAPARSTSSPST